MTLKFLVDESSGKKLTKFLIEKGYDAVFVADFMAGSANSEIIKKAENENRILITNDKDLGRIIFRLGRPSYGVILLRPRVDNPKARIELVNAILLSFPDKLKGYFIVATEDKIRIKEISKQD